MLGVYQQPRPAPRRLLGEAVEPSRAERVTPWWRAAAAAVKGPAAEPEAMAPAAEGDPDARVEWPID